MTDRSLDGPSVWRLDTFFVPPGALGSRAVVLDGAEAHHAVHVVRAVPGDVVRLIDGEGSEAIGRIDRVDASNAWLSVLEAREHRRGEGVELALIQALLKGKGFSEVVRRSTELGVAALVPVTTERTLGRVRKGSEGERAARWRAVARSALKQCRGVYLPRIEPVRPRLIALVVGPEGGLSPAEVRDLRAAGTEPVSIGRRVLRADWAGPAAAAMVASAVGGLLP